MTVYLRHGVPLEGYLLTSQDHRNQEQSEQIGHWVAEQTAQWKAEEAADPQLKEARRITVQTLTVMASQKAPDRGLIRWRLRLYCDHIIEATRHHTIDNPVSAGGTATWCTYCGRDPVVIVAYEPICLEAKAAEPADTTVSTPQLRRRWLEAQTRPT
ncbi:hypothetical protein [Nocardia mangyaensis]|uniref:hypothetical protein n=1 Tax=Nocardia mangyaensis TaxID=2213200 RepID=UPI0012EC4690|nr:hypothetical protein [Nocardia mangyaensis]